MAKNALIWLRSDLRLHDLAAFDHAQKHHDNIYFVYFHAPNLAGKWARGAANRVFLHQQLNRLNQQIQARGGQLMIQKCVNIHELQSQILDLSHELGAKAIYWGREYEPEAIVRDTAVKNFCRENGLIAESFNHRLLIEPWALGKPYKVFTPFWKAAQTHLQNFDIPAPEKLTKINILNIKNKNINFLEIKDLDLLPNPNENGWDDRMLRYWQPSGEDFLNKFINSGLRGYKTKRDFPSLPNVSKLSPYLHLGVISPFEVFRAASAMRPNPDYAEKDILHFLSEIGWREFAHHLLFHFPNTTDQPLNPNFEKYPWENNPAQLAAWQAGKTGIPLVDAGMRELWATGWMHNRVRMVVASFLCKHLRIAWQDGASWFWDTLVDADLANNTLGWQWTAGCGADAAPYFRVFNPILQSVKFDPDAHYLKQWLPELADLSAADCHEPWKLGALALEARGYVMPIIDLAEGRAKALAGYELVKNNIFE